MPTEREKITLGKILGTDITENFEDFDLTEIKKVLASLASEDAIDIAHAEMLQQKTLYAADILVEYIAKLIKTVSYLESKLNSIKNKVALEYNAPNGRTTADMKKQAGEASPEVEVLALKLARAKGSKSYLERTYEILLKSHHHFKDLSTNQKRSMISSQVSGQVNWE